MSKVICICNKSIGPRGEQGAPCSELTKGKEYNVIEEHDKYIKVINDNGILGSYYKWRFEAKEEVLPMTPTGYTLKNTYPGCKEKLGEVVPSDHKLAPLLPECYTPIFHKEYKKGTWVVVESFGSLISASAFSTGTPYKLAEDFTYQGNCFCVEEDNNGWRNGWSGSISPHHYFKQIKLREATKEEIGVEENIYIGGYKLVAHKGVGSFGCKDFTKESVQILFDILDDEDMDAKLTIRGEEITPSLLQKILNKLK